MSDQDLVNDRAIVVAKEAQLPPVSGLEYGPLGPHHYLYTEARAFAKYADLGTDKATAHQYQMLYAKVLWPYRQRVYAELQRRGLVAPDDAMLDPAADDKPFKMLEIGLGCTMPIPFGGFHLFRRSPDIDRTHVIGIPRCQIAGHQPQGPQTMSDARPD